MAVFAADLLARRADRLEKPIAAVVPLLGLLAVSGLLVLKQPDMGTAMVLAFITFALLYAGGVPLRPVLKALGVTAAIGLIVGLAEPYRRARLLSFLDPFAHAKGSGYQVVQSLVGLGSGHLYGLGLGGGREKWGLLPNAHTDFIFSVIGEEGGLVGHPHRAGPVRRARVVRAARRRSARPDRFGALLAVAATSWITSQAVINIGAVIGVLPVTGHPAAVHLLRRVVPRHHPGGGGDPRQRGVARATSGSWRTGCARGPRGLEPGRPQGHRHAAPPRPRVSTRRYALVAGGGTGGHLVPALAVARALDDGPRAGRGRARGRAARPRRRAPGGRGPARHPAARAGHRPAPSTLVPCWPTWAR